MLGRIKDQKIQRNFSNSKKEKKTITTSYEYDVNTMIKNKSSFFSNDFQFPHRVKPCYIQNQKQDEVIYVPNNRKLTGKCMFKESKH